MLKAIKIVSLIIAIIIFIIPIYVNVIIANRLVELLNVSKDFILPLSGIPFSWGLVLILLVIECLPIIIFCRR